MEVKHITKYVSRDGREFDTAERCRNYEVVNNFAYLQNVFELNTSIAQQENTLASLSKMLINTLLLVEQHIQHGLSKNKESEIMYAADAIYAMAKLLECHKNGYYEHDKTFIF